MLHFILVGLGNPGGQYENTRHNVGRMSIEMFAKANDFSNWSFDKKLKALVSSGRLLKVKGQRSIVLMLPETFMNKSGLSVEKIKGLKLKKVKGTKGEISNLVVVHDDLDIPFGKFKISFNKSSGGHRGVESIIKALETEGFTRVRIGISPQLTSGKLKKPLGEEAVEKHILGKFKSSEMEEFKKICKKVSESLAMIVSEGRERAMGNFNSL